ncbi:MAG: hypothetical protein PWQ18_369 [Clostridia bacterium]|nr:hypothetical protein [Clostridia bacterium]
MLGFIFDCYRVGRYLGRPGVVATYIGDISFWVLFTALAFTLLMLINWGEVRVYVFLALALGVTLYTCFLSRGVRRGLYTGGRWLAGLWAFNRRLLRRTVLVVIMPGRWFLTGLMLPFTPLRHFWRRWRPPGGPPGGVAG